MGLDMGPQGPPRDPTKHPEIAGQKLLGDKTKGPEPGTVPTVKTLPPTPTPPRPTVTGYQPHRPSEFGPRHCKTGVKTGGGTNTDQVRRPQVTRMRGSLPTKGWRVAKETPRLLAKRAKAAKWEAKKDTRLTPKKKKKR